MLNERMKDFKPMLVHTFDEHCKLGLYTLKYHLVGHIMADLRISGTLSVLHSIPYDHFNNSYKIISQRRQTSTMETKTVLHEDYITPL